MSNSTPPDLLSQPTAPQEPQPLLTGGVYQGFENDLRAIARSKNVTGPIQQMARQHLEKRKR